MCDMCKEIGPPRYDLCYMCETLSERKSTAVHGSFTQNTIYPAQEFPNNQSALRNAVDAMEYTQEIYDIDIHHRKDENRPLINGPIKTNPFTGEISEPKPDYTRNPLSIDMPLPPAPKYVNNFETRGRKLYRPSP